MIFFVCVCVCVCVYIYNVAYVPSSIIYTLAENSHSRKSLTFKIVAFKGQNEVEDDQWKLLKLFNSGH
jgi:cytochrome c biogenesis factor